MIARAFGQRPLSPIGASTPVLIVADVYAKRLDVAAPVGRVVTIDPAGRIDDTSESFHLTRL